VQSELEALAMGRSTALRATAGERGGVRREAGAATRGARPAVRTALASVTVSAMGDMRLYLSRPVKLRSGSCWQHSGATAVQRPPRAMS
jgi:hypothetical protein